MAGKAFQAAMVDESATDSCEEQFHNNHETSTMKNQ